MRKACMVGLILMVAFALVDVAVGAELVGDPPSEEALITGARKVVVNVTKGWQFRPDPKGQAEKERWWTEEYNKADWGELEVATIDADDRRAGLWQPIKVAKSWEDQGYRMDGDGWYRVRFAVPDVPEEVPLLLHFAGADETAWLYLNGRQVAHRGGIAADIWNKPFAVDVSKEVRRNAENLLVVHVHDGGFAGGLTGAVRLYTHPDRKERTKLVGDSSDATRRNVNVRYSELLMRYGVVEQRLWQIQRMAFYIRQAGLDDSSASDTLKTLEKVRKSAFEELESLRQIHEDLFLKGETRKDYVNVGAKAERLADSVNSQLTYLDKETGRTANKLPAQLGPKILPGFKATAVDENALLKQRATVDGRGRATGLVMGFGVDMHQIPLVAMLEPDFVSCFGAMVWGDENGQPIRSEGWEKGYRTFRERYDFSFIQHYRTATHNSIVTPEWFREKYKDDPDILAVNGAGERARWRRSGPPVMIGHDPLCIHHPAVGRLAATHMKANALWLNDHPGCVVAAYSGEPAYKFSGGGGRELGYGRPARAAFREWLKNKFKSIGALNKAWKSNYASFDAVEPAADAYKVHRHRATPLTYEFERFRRDSYTAHFKLSYDSFKEHNPDVAIIDWGGGGIHLFNRTFDTACDVYQMQKVKTADILAMHKNSNYNNVPMIVYQRSMARYFDDKPTGNMEYVWSYRRDPWVDSHDEFRAVGFSNTFRHFMWGNTVLDVFGPEMSTWSHYKCSFLEPYVRHTRPGARHLWGRIMRREMRWFPQVKIAARKLWPAVSRTKVVKPRIAILQPSLSTINVEYPYNQVMHAGADICYLLLPNNYHHLFVPEEAILDGKEDLRGFKVMFIPYGAYFPDGLAARLLEFVRGGGSIVACGPPGVYDKYGRMVNGFLSAVGITAEQDPKTDSWTLKVDERGGVTVVETDAAGSPLIVDVSFGKGHITVSLLPWHDMGTLVFDLIKGAGAGPMAWSEGALMATDSTRYLSVLGRGGAPERVALELLVREDDKGGKYLCVLNRSYRTPRQDWVSVPGRYARIVDLGAGGGMPVRAHYRDGVTRFKVHLNAGEGTVFSLK